MSLSNNIYFYTVPLSSIIIQPSVPVLEVLYGSVVNLTCMVNSVIAPTVIWTTDTGITIMQPPLVDNGNNMYNSVLTLYQVTLNNSGMYTCTSTNVNGSASDTANVSVLCKFSFPRHLIIKYFSYHIVPPPAVNVSNISLIQYNSSVTLTCTVYSLVPITVTWIGPDGKRLSSNFATSGTTTHISLPLNAVNLNTSGVYSCLATNGYGGSGMNQAIITVYGKL